MTPSDCLSKICESPDITCPSCGKTMTVWVKDETPIYRCNECNGIAFPLDKPKLEKALKKAQDKAISEMTCSGCGQSLIEIRSEDYMLDSCKGCSFIFARPRSEHWDNEPEQTREKYQVVISWLSEIYEDIYVSL